MSSLFNIIWFILVGWFSALCMLILSGLFAITIVGIPIAKALLQLAKLNAVPFGKELVRETEANNQTAKVSSLVNKILNIVWLPIGIILIVAYVILGLLASITIIGIPVGIVYIRMGKFLLAPVGLKVISKKKAYAVAVANELQKNK